MDYLQYIVNSFRVKHPYRVTRSSLIGMFDETKYRLEEVDFKQVNRIISAVSDVVASNKKIYGGTSAGEHSDKKKLYLIALEEFYESMKNEDISPSTMFHLIRMVESDSMKPIKNILFQSLFKSGSPSFNRLIRQSMEPISRIELGGDDLTLFGYGFRRTTGKEEIS